MEDRAILRKTFWRDAATGGGVIGLLLFVIALVQVNTEAGWVGTLLSLLDFLIIGYFIYFYARKRSVLYGNEGFTYGQSMGFIIAMMLFTGFIMGVGNFLLSNYIAPDYYEQMYEAALEANPFYDPDSADGEMLGDLFVSFRRNPLFNIFTGIFGYIFYGGIIGLLASAFVKRKPDIFADNTTLDD